LWIAFRRLKGMQMQINQLRSDVNVLRGYYGLSVWALSPKSRSPEARKWLTLREAEQPVNEPAPDVGAPEISSEQKQEKS
jgi:hypothetical protein